METPLNQETATADLITDVILPSLSQPSDLSELARNLADETATWREAWAVGRYAEDPAADGALTTPPLTAAEDEELRRLNRLAEIGTLAGSKAERLIELRLRDRREKVRERSELSGEEQRVAAANASPRFLGRRRR